MALTTTTNSAAIAVNDVTIKVASATGFAKGYLIKVGDEEMTQTAEAVGTIIPVFRGVNGTYNKAHGVTSNVTVGAGSDFANADPTVVSSYPISGRARIVKSYGAAGAITLPTPGNDALAIINGTGALAMTLANPTKDQDGDILTILANGKAAHTVTYTAGFGDAGGSYDVVTFTASGVTGFSVIAANALWVLISPMTGTLTNCVPALA